MPLLAVSVIADTNNAKTDQTLPELIYKSSEHFTDTATVDLDGLLNRIGDARLVLLGEATHGTVEFYDMRARISRELIEKKGFNVIAIEADWPDAESINHYIHGSKRGAGQKLRYTKKTFSDFPEWMWRNRSFITFTQWLKDHNQQTGSSRNAISLYGLDFYNLFGSMESVLNYLQEVDPETAVTAYRSYSCLMPWAIKPKSYTGVIKSGRHRGCEREVLAVYQALSNKQSKYKQLDTKNYFNAVQNARLVKNGERFYRTMYHNDTELRNLRHKNLFESLINILDFHGKNTKVIVWAHNSHIGDSRATDMSDYGESNLGQRVREKFGDNAYLIGFGTDHGAVSASSEWGGPVKIMQVRPSRSDSYEWLFHKVDADNFLLSLRQTGNEIRKKLLPERLERAIGTSYDPDDELKKHYFYASLPKQFDEYIWFDETHAVTNTVASD